MEATRHLGRVAARPIEPGATLGEAPPHHGTVGTSSSSPAATRNAVSASMIAARCAGWHLGHDRGDLPATSPGHLAHECPPVICQHDRDLTPVAGADRSLDKPLADQSITQPCRRGRLDPQLARQYTDVQPVIVTVEYDECAELRECDGVVDRRDRPRRHRHQRPRREQDGIGDGIQLLGLRRRPPRHMCILQLLATAHFRMTVHAAPDSCRSLVGGCWFAVWRAGSVA